MQDKKRTKNDPVTIWSIRLPPDLAIRAAERAESLDLYRGGYLRQLIKRDLDGPNGEGGHAGSDTVFD